MAADLSVIYRISADISGLQSSVDKGVAAMSKMEKAGLAIGKAIGTAISLQKVSAAVTHITDMTGHLDDLARKAGISAEAVQELDFVAKQSGSTFDQIANGLAQMGNRLTEGDKSAVASIKAMGLSVEQLKASAPDVAFQAIGEAIAKIPDPMERSKVAMDIFGKSGAAFLPVLISNIGELRETARTTGLVISNDLVRSGDELGDRWDQLTTKLDALKTKALLPALELFVQMPDSLQTVAAGFLGILNTLGPLLIGLGSIFGPGAIWAAMTSAFEAALPFLGPVGWVAAGAIAVYEAFKHWEAIEGFARGAYTSVQTYMVDKFLAAKNAIVTYAQQIYDGVKSYLVDKFNAIVSSITGKIMAVQDAFRGLYEAVVGHSYVPDLIKGIEREFGKLDRVMTHPVDVATSKVMDLFRGMADKVGSLLDAWIPGLGSLLGPQLSRLFESLAPIIADGLTWLGGKVWDGLKAIGHGIATAFGFGGPDWLNLPFSERPQMPGGVESGHEGEDTGEGVRVPWEGMGMVGAATGFEGWVRKPTPFLVGEGGEPEYVSITPASRALRDAGGGGWAVTVVHTNLQVDGVTLAKIVTRHQENDYRNQRKVRAA